MNKGLTVECKVHFKQQRRGRKRLAVGSKSVPVVVRAGRVSRISRLMALAIYFDELVARGEVKDYAELARLGHVTRARVTQIMNLLNLAPAIQEWLLFLPATNDGHDSIKEWQVRPLLARAGWNHQLKLIECLRTIGNGATRPSLVSGAMPDRSGK